MVDVQRPFELVVPDVRSAHMADEKRARELAQAYWEYLEYYHLIWGCWPWERGRQRVKTEYVYEQDPKQKARDYVEYMRARRLLRVEQEIAAQIERLNENREEASARFKMFVYLHTVAPRVRADLDHATPEAKKRVLTEFIEECRQRFGSIQVIPLSEIPNMLANSAYVSTFLQSGWDTLLGQWNRARTARDRADLVEEVFAHDKGYPRAVNFAQMFVPLHERTVESVLYRFMNGFANTNIFTGRRDDSSVLEQIQARRKRGLDADARQTIWTRIVGEIALRLDIRSAEALVQRIEQDRAMLETALNDVLPLDETAMLFDAYLEPCATSLFPEASREETHEDTLNIVWNSFQMMFSGVDFRRAAGQAQPYHVGDVFTLKTNKQVSYRIVVVGNMKANYQLERVT